MRYRVQHTTHYQYAARVSHCYNLAFVTPRMTDRQQVETSQLSIQPQTSNQTQRIDYFGNVSHHFEILKPHKELTIHCESIVETQSQPCVDRLNTGLTCAETLAALQSAESLETRLAREFILDSSMIDVSEELKAYAEPTFQPDQPFLACVMALTQRIFTEFKYSPESTTIATPLSEVLAKRQGVCQDFAHLQIACLRALGFPARYVSGYLETLPPPGQEKLVGADATHAWLSVYSVDEGWVEFDPTNNCLANEQHIVTAFGRDYFDVTPLRGVIFGGGTSPVLKVSVDVARV